MTWRCSVPIASAWFMRACMCLKMLHSKSKLRPPGAYSADYFQNVHSVFFLGYGTA
jgi:hypothetical protein